MFLSSMMKYLFDNFATLNELAHSCNISNTQILKMIEDKLIPTYSYAIRGKLYTENYIFGKKESDCDLECYYHKSNELWIKQADILLKTKSIQEVQAIIFNQFRERFLELLIQNHSPIFNFNKLFDGNDSIIMEKFDSYFSEIYHHWLMGTFGVCVKHPNNFDNIFYKEFYQAHIQSILDNKRVSDLVDKDKILLKEVLFNYEKYISEFSPVEYLDSTRKKYINHLLPQLK